MPAEDVHRCARCGLYRRQFSDDLEAPEPTEPSCLAHLYRQNRPDRLMFVVACRDRELAAVKTKLSKAMSMLDTVTRQLDAVLEEVT